MQPQADRGDLADGLGDLAPLDTPGLGRQLLQGGGRVAEQADVLGQVDGAQGYSCLSGCGNWTPVRR
ncbi:hypothetical protein GTY68_27520 [Streptomyces sp. SID4926]|nr:hypothetical protein [Streptomyces sp. SID4926]